MGKITIEIPNYSNLTFEKECDDKYCYKVFKNIQKDIKEFEERTKPESAPA